MTGRPCKIIPELFEGAMDAFHKQYGYIFIDMGPWGNAGTIYRKVVSLSTGAALPLYPTEIIYPEEEPTSEMEK